MRDEWTDLMTRDIKSNSSFTTLSTNILLKNVLTPKLHYFYYAIL